MTYSEFLDILVEHKINFEYVGFKHSNEITIPTGNEREIYTFNISLKPDEEKQYKGVWYFRGFLWDTGRIN